MSKFWKWFGLAGIAGVAAGGAGMARRERVRRAYTPDQIRERLHQRLASSDGALPSRPPTEFTGGEEMMRMSNNGQPGDHLPDTHRDTELQMAEESEPAQQPEHGTSSAPMMDLE